MRMFINKNDDLWTAIEAKRVIKQNLKPKPHKDYLELNEDEKTIARCEQHFILVFLSREGSEMRVKQSMINMICKSFPELAAKHSLKSDHKWEFWRTDFSQQNNKSLTLQEEDSDD